MPESALKDLSSVVLVSMIYVVYLHSSPNSCCRDGFHALATGLDPEPSGFIKLAVLAHFSGQLKVSKGVENKRGLGAVNGVAKAVAVG